MISKEMQVFLKEEKQMLLDNISDLEERIQKNKGSKSTNQQNLILYRKLVAELGVMLKQKT